MDESLQKDRYEKRRSRPENRTVFTEVTSPMGEDDQHHGHLAHGRGRPAPRSPRPWARTTSTTVTSPMGEDDQHHGHLAHGRGRPAYLFWLRLETTSRWFEDDFHDLLISFCLFLSLCSLISLHLSSLITSLVALPFVIFATPGASYLLAGGCASGALEMRLFVSW
ncbi:hypothetical protein F2Q68_00021677 [Brassica cretica]|uniref:Uncharacterized protein n=1 Tax=Brassica cretica TaxID=69181 RepID=A0A8S9FWM5_BRACR|nr:hypothetical protein F2Q68_00021677 [Brassica cretica]